MKKDVFISYKSEEFEEADWVRSVLEHNGISCWMAPTSITGGSSYAKEIPQAIRDCKVFVLILSEKSQISKWVPRELDQAINENKTVMPFMLENCVLKDDFNFYLSNVQRYAAYQSKAEAMEKMVREIRAILGVSSEKNNENVSRQEPVPGMPETGSVTPAPTEAPLLPVAKPKKKREKRVRQKKEKTGTHALKNKRKKWGIVAAAVSAIVVLSVIVYAGTHVTVAGEKYRKNETYLYLHDATLTSSDAAAIQKMEKLRTLELKNCTIEPTDLRFLSALPLQTLNLVDCGLTQAQLATVDLTDMPLNSVDFSGNDALTSLDLFQPHAASLHALNISRTGITDISDLEAFTALATLEANDNNLQDASALAACTDLSKVCLNGNALQNVSFLQNCTELTELQVNGNHLTDLTGLENSIRLHTLQAGGNQLTDISGLMNATCLQFVFLNDNQLVDASVLEKSAANLKNVYLKNNRLTNVDFLANSTELMYLNVDANEITSLQSLKNCTKLVGLSAAKNAISDVTGLTECGALQYLNLSGNQVALQNGESVSMCAQGGAVLDFSNNQIHAAPISELCECNYLLLHGNPMTDYTALYSASGNLLVLDYSDQIDFSRLAQADFNLIHILDCPLDKQVTVGDALGYKVRFMNSDETENYEEDYLTNEMRGVPAYFQ